MPIWALGKVAASLGFDQIEEPIRDVHGFWTAYQTWPEPMYFRQLDTKTQRAMEQRKDESMPVE